MLTNEQSFEVVEKVWGWDGEMITDHWREAKIYVEIKDHIKNEVNSWEGFGRTIEAMAPEWQFVPWDDITGTGQIGFMNKDQIFFPVIWDHSNPLDMINEVHITALEAMK